MSPLSSIPTQYVQLPDKYCHLTPLEYTAKLIDYVKQYNHLIKIHIVDFLTLHEWDLLDTEWQTALLPGAENDQWIHSIVNITSGDAVDVSHFSL